MSEKVISFQLLQQKHQESQVLRRWNEFYTAQRHEDLLEALVSEHEHDFPLRRSPDRVDQLRHKALVTVLQERAQTEFLKSLLVEINGVEIAKK